MIKKAEIANKISELTKEKAQHEIVIRSWDKKVTKLAKSFSEQLKKLMGFKEDERNSLFEDSVYAISSEIEYVFRSLPLISKHLVVEEDYSGDCTKYYITKEHGIKRPYSQHSHRIQIFEKCEYDARSLGQSENEICVDSNCDLVCTSNVKLKLSMLANDPHVNQTNFIALSNFMRETIMILKEARKIDNFMNDKDENDIRNSLRISHYSDLKDLTEALVALKEVEKKLPAYREMRLEFMKKKAKLLEELIEFNKPFKVMLKLASGNSSSTNP
jgi:hypothetical protein